MSAPRELGKDAKELSTLFFLFLQKIRLRSLWNWITEVLEYHTWDYEGKQVKF